MRPILGAMVVAAAAMTLCRNDAAAQNPVRTLDIGGPPGESQQRCYSDSMLTAALAIYNGPAAVRVFGDLPVAADVKISGDVGVYRGSVRVDGRIDGRLVVLDGDARITATGVVTGDVIVLGGRLTVDPAASTGRRSQCDQPVALDHAPAGTLSVQPAKRPLTRLTSDIAISVGDARVAPHVGIGTYNRIEAAPLQLGATAEWAPMVNDSLHLDGYGIFRTARDPSGSRPAVGWYLDGAWTHRGSLPFTLRAAGGSRIEATADRPGSALESSLSALFLRRDHRDWLLWRGVRLSAEIRPTAELGISAGVESSRQTTVLAVDAFSLFRGTETWRPNPLIDDGRYRILSAGVRWDARNANRHPVLSWYLAAQIRRTSSNDISPVSLPTIIRDSIPTTGYGSTDGDFDLRGYFRLDPVQRLVARISAAGYLGGDPLTIQNRHSAGGPDPLIGYDFRAINCERRRKADPALPALCDREMAIQVEYRRQLPLRFTSRLGGYNIGIHNPELVVLGDAASAWLAGDSAGRVPGGRIQAIGEWQSEFGVGISTPHLGLYLAKSLVLSSGVRFQIVFGHRF
ncbi:MAG: hypothetical protein ACREL5_02965 [Gemmatimonadales bacterium]